jgi:hypothetical protein
MVAVDNRTDYSIALTSTLLIDLTMKEDE